MTEAPHDNVMQHEFVVVIWTSRTSLCCAPHAALSNFRHSFAGRPRIKRQTPTYNRCVCFDRHDRTGKNPGDKLLAGR
jgi:hypothetical protein